MSVKQPEDLQQSNVDSEFVPSSNDCCMYGPEDNLKEEIRSRSVIDVLNVRLCTTFGIAS